MTLYGLFRFFIEFFREPDYQIGLLYKLMTMGQILSLPMILLGILLTVNGMLKNKKNEF